MWNLKETVPPNVGPATVFVGGGDQFARHTTKHCLLYVSAFMCFILIKNLRYSTNAFGGAKIVAFSSGSVLGVTLCSKCEEARAQNDVAANVP
eukprot:401700-Amphidinium_carterae.1